VKKNKIFGIKTVDVNGCKVYTLNIIINPSSMILNKIIADPIWKNMHTLDMRDGKSRVNFTYTTLDYDEFGHAVRKLRDILFAHKVNKLMNDNPWVFKKEDIIKEVLTQIDAEKDSFLL
jgi:hypothetical protein